MRIRSTPFRRDSEITRPRTSVKHLVLYLHSTPPVNHNQLKNAPICILPDLVRDPTPRALGLNRARRGTGLPRVARKTADRSLTSKKHSPNRFSAPLSRSNQRRNNRPIVCLNVHQKSNLGSRPAGGSGPTDLLHRPDRSPHSPSFHSSVRFNDQSEPFHPSKRRIARNRDKKTRSAIRRLPNPILVCKNHTFSVTALDRNQDHMLVHA